MRLTGGRNSNDAVFTAIPDFTKLAITLNQDGKSHYYEQIAKKGDTTQTVLEPSDRHTLAFQALQSKMQTKAYRSNQPSKTSYVEAKG